MTSNLKRHIIEHVMPEALRIPNFTDSHDLVNLFFETAAAGGIELLEKVEVRKFLRNITLSCPLEEMIRYYETIFDSYTDDILFDQRLCSVYGELASNLGKLDIESGGSQMIITRTIIMFAHIFTTFVQNFNALSSSKDSIILACNILVGVCGLNTKPDTYYKQPSLIDRSSIIVNAMQKLATTLIEADLEALVLNSITSQLVITFTKACAQALPDLVNNAIVNNLHSIIFNQKRFDFLISDKNVLPFYQAIVECYEPVRVHILNELTGRFMNNYDMNVANYLLNTAIENVKHVGELKRLNVSIMSLSVLGTCFRLKFPKSFRIIIRKCLDFNYDVAELIDNITIIFDCCEPKERKRYLVQCLIEFKNYKILARTITAIQHDGLQILYDFLNIKEHVDKRAVGYLKNMLVSGLEQLCQRDLTMLIHDSLGFDIFRQIISSEFIGENSVAQQMLNRITTEIAEFITAKNWNPYAFVSLWTIANIVNRYSIAKSVQKNKKSTNQIRNYICYDLLHVNDFPGHEADWIEREERQIHWQILCGEHPRS
ncbi:hypothetical protein GJ496_003252 [Pomphorhynchus laevis]|nr:hypothetical protein GJ496_003252 [Pomphorhynchus laevis]